MQQTHHTPSDGAQLERRRITIDPITRLEGHGKIVIFLDDGGDVERAFFQVPELRGFEKFCEGRPAEEMPGSRRGFVASALQRTTWRRPRRWTTCGKWSRPGQQSCCAN